MPQALRAAIRGQVKQVVIIHPDKGRFQQTGEGQVILGQQQGAGQRQQVHHRDLFRQGNPIHPGDRNAAAFQFPHQRIDQNRSALDQEQDVPGADRSPLCRQDFLVPNPATDGFCQTFRQGLGGICGTAAFQAGNGEQIILLRFGWDRGGPDLDPTLQTGTKGMVLQRRFIWFHDTITGGHFGKG